MQFADAPDQSYKPSVDRWITAWQYTSCGDLAGIKGDVDLNISYEDPVAWTQPVAESIQQQLAPLGVCGVVHKVKIPGERMIGRVGPLIKKRDLN